GIRARVICVVELEVANAGGDGAAPERLAPLSRNGAVAESEALAIPGSAIAKGCAVGAVAWTGGHVGGFLGARRKRRQERRERHERAERRESSHCGCPHLVPRSNHRASTERSSGRTTNAQQAQFEPISRAFRVGAAHGTAPDA